MAKRIVWTEQARTDLRSIEQPPLIRLRAQNHRLFFRGYGNFLKIERVLDRKKAYR